MANTKNDKNKYNVMSKGGHFVLYTPGTIYSVTGYTSDEGKVIADQDTLETAQPVMYKPGDTVTISVIPSKCYTITEDSVTLYDENQVKINNIELKKVDSLTYTFFMPDQNIKISADFEKLYSVVKEPPVAKENLVYTGENQELISAGSLDDEPPLAAKWVDNAEYPVGTAVTSTYG